MKKSWRGFLIKSNSRRPKIAWGNIMSLPGHHRLRRGALLLAGLLLCHCAPSRKSFVHPADISYQDVPGFHPASGLEVYEWSAAVNDSVAVSASLSPPRGLRLRWLGTAGFELSDDQTTILIDPFVSRPTVRQLWRKLTIDTAAVNRYVLAPLRREKLKAVLVSHPHHDHFQDVPYILSQYPEAAARPAVIGSRNVLRLLQGYGQNCGIAWAEKIGGLQNTRMQVVEFTSHHKNCADSSRQAFCRLGKFGDFAITAFGSHHPSYDYLPGVVIDGFVCGGAPYRAAAYKTWRNTSVNFLIEYRGLRLLFAESPLVRHAGQIGRVDILLQGIASRRDGDGIANTLAALQPRYVIPAHYDDFFKPFTAFEKFDARIGEGPVDFSRFEDFVRGFEAKYVARARLLLEDKSRPLHSQLRLLKLFYYYSLENLIAARP